MNQSSQYTSLIKFAVSCCIWSKVETAVIGFTSMEPIFLHLHHPKATRGNDREKYQRHLKASTMPQELGSVRKRTLGNLRTPKTFRKLDPIAAPLQWPGSTFTIFDRFILIYV